ncbi:hypothetical protein, partial [Pseudomonas sp. NPDC012596]|uniref:hypothetical protein n=1 Tax=Pseudomonas sp. NPDC012596 TaxID=3364419 RepID=UPI00367EA160
MTRKLTSIPSISKNTNKIGHLLSKRTEDGTTDYGYDAADNLLSITFTDNKGEQQQLD